MANTQIPAPALTLQNSKVAAFGFHTGLDPTRQRKLAQTGTWSCLSGILGTYPSCLRFKVLQTPNMSGQLNRMKAVKPTTPCNASEFETCSWQCFAGALQRIAGQSGKANRTTLKLFEIEVFFLFSAVHFPTRAAAGRCSHGSWRIFSHGHSLCCKVPAGRIPAFPAHSQSQNLKVEFGT